MKTTSSQGRRSSVKTIPTDIYVEGELWYTDQWPAKLWRDIHREAQKYGITTDQLINKALLNLQEHQRKAVAA